MSTRIVYSYEFSSVGTVDYGSLGAFGNLVLAFGIIFVAVATVKMALKRKNSLVS